MPDYVKLHQLRIPMIKNNAFPRMALSSGTLDFRISSESIIMSKASGCDRIPVGLFQILKDDAVKVLHSYASKFGKLSSGHGTGKGQFSFQSTQRKAMPKNAQTTAQLHSSHMLVK